MTDDQKTKEPKPLDLETVKWAYRFIEERLCDDYWETGEGETHEGYDCACGGRQLLREIKLSYPCADEEYGEAP